MKIIKTYKNFLNETKYGTVNFSDVMASGTFSPKYHLADELSEIKKDYKKLGKNKIIEKIIKILSKIDNKIYNKIVNESEKKYDIKLPNFKSATKISYWKSHWSNASKIIIMLSTLTNGIDKEKENIKKEINKLESKLNILDKLKETNEWSPWGNTVYNEYIPNSKDKYEYVGYNEIPENGDEPIETYDIVYENGEDVDKKDLEKYISLETLKTMFPVYNDADFFKDWSVKLYKYKNYFLIQQSGWLYLFRKA